MSDVWLGQTPPTTADRDATHVAVVPVEAVTEMEPGSHCTVLPNGKAALGGETIGIVDPFLRHKVKKGERFYLCLYPRSVTGLRHVYSHPALDAALGGVADRKQASEQWLRQFCASADCPGYETTIGLAVRHGQCGGEYDDEYLFFRDMDAHGEIPPEFWEHLEVVSGQKMTHRATHFTCSC